MEDDNGQEEFLLKWNDHHNSFFSIVQDLCASELLTDVTLACGSGDPIIFEAHKLMLSVCSTFFRNILTRKRADRYQAHPIVFLKDVEPRHMEQLLQYMYRGEINVLQNDLGPLIETARALQVKGLADAPPGTGASEKKPKLLHQLPTLQQHLPPPLKKAKTNHQKKESRNQHPQLPPTSHLAQRLTQPKRPPFMPPLPTEPEPPENIRSRDDQIDLWGAPVVGDQENNSGDGTDFSAYTETELHDEDSNYDQVSEILSFFHSFALSGLLLCLGFFKMSSKDNFAQVFGGGNSFGLSNNSGNDSGGGILGSGGDGSGLNISSSSRLRYKCEECGKGFITPSKLQRHSYSHSGLRPFQCTICAKSFSQSANLKTHIKNTHPETFQPSSMTGMGIDADQLHSQLQSQSLANPKVFLSAATGNNPEAASAATAPASTTDDAIAKAIAEPKSEPSEDNSESSNAAVDNPLQPDY